MITSRHFATVAFGALAAAIAIPAAAQTAEPVDQAKADATAQGSPDSATSSAEPQDVVVLLHGAHVRRHDLGDLGRRGRLRLGGGTQIGTRIRLELPAKQVHLTDDPDQPVLVVHHRRGRDVALVQQTDGLLHRPVHGHGHDRRGHHLANQHPDHLHDSIAPHRRHECQRAKVP